MESLDRILIFQTNILNPSDKQKIKPVLDGHLEILDWHIDQQDRDCVLRLVSRSLDIPQVVSLIESRGYQCRELTW